MAKVLVRRSAPQGGGEPAVYDATLWATAGGNPQRTSWVATSAQNQTELTGNLNPRWYRPIEPYISKKAAPVVGNGMVFVSTAKGLYAFDALTGAQEWIYPTALPLGHSATYADTAHGPRLYVGGHDHKLHAINADTGAGVWTYEAGAGFQTNPLYVNGRIYAGNRDGVQYALTDNGASAALLWQYTTDAPILVSTALSLDGQRVYFANSKMRAYALDAMTGALLWQSAQLPGHSMTSWWPVVHQEGGQEYVLLTGTQPYRVMTQPGPTNNTWQILDAEEAYPGYQAISADTALSDSLGRTTVNPFTAEGLLDLALPNAWYPAGVLTRTYTDRSEVRPDWRSVFVLHAATGIEVTFDIDNDGQPDYAPLNFMGTYSGNRYPLVVGTDNRLYAGAEFMFNKWISGGGPVGWQLGSRYMANLSVDWYARDEAIMCSSAGKMLYWLRINDRKAGSIDVTLPNTRYAGPYSTDPARERYLWSYDLKTKAPGYDIMVSADQRAGDVGAYGGNNGVYGEHGDGPAPVPYLGKLFFLASNALLAFDAAAGAPTSLPLAAAPVVTPPARTYTTGQLATRLTDAVLDIIGDCLESENWAACHLKPGMSFVTLQQALDRTAAVITQWQYARGDYFANPGDYLPVLLRALPYLDAGLRAKLRSYIAWEFANYPPDTMNHIGWNAGVSRDWFTYSATVAAGMNTAPSIKGLLNPQNTYTLWLYAQEFGGAAALLARAAAIWQTPPDDATLETYPFLHNAFISQFEGYLGLQELAGVPLDAAKVAELDRLLALRASTFTVNSPFVGYYFQMPGSARPTNLWRQFYLLTPRTAAYLRANALALVQAWVDEYSRVAPFWFVAHAEEAWSEGVMMAAYDIIGLFTAKARILQEPRAALAPYLDVPIMRGDLFHMQNLLDLLDAPDTDALTTVTTPQVLTTGPIAQYDKFEIAFDVQNSPASDTLLTYAQDPAGITVDVLLTKPDASAQVIPCFWYQPYTIINNGVSPTGAGHWRARLLAETPGTYQYRVRVVDANGTATSAAQTFTAVASANAGYVRVNGKFFEFADGAPFPYLLVNPEQCFNTLATMQTNVPLLADHDVRFLRWWPTAESGHYSVVPYGGDQRVYWGFGPAYLAWDFGDTASGDQFSRRHYYYTAQAVPAVAGDTYRLQVRALVEGEQVLRVEFTGLNAAPIDIVAPENTLHTPYDYQQAGWQTYTITGTATAATLTVNLRGLYVQTDAPAPYNDVRAGNVRTGQVSLQRDEGGSWGPNLIYHGAPDAHKAIDAVGAGRLDEWFQLAEQHGLYARMALFHKEDATLSRLLAGGTLGAASVTNFYTSPISLKYQEAYIRYFMARWGYSPALHSVEQANENMIDQTAYEAGWRYAALVDQYAPRPQIVSNTFWGWWHTNFWQDATNGHLLDHGDKHWYANQGAENPELISHTWADTVANVRECRARFLQYAYDKPIIRGETGVAISGTEPQDPAIAAEATGIYYHKQVWAHVGILGDQCAGEWYPRLFVTGGAYPNATYRTEDMHAAYGAFMAGEAVNNGTHVEVGTDTTGVTSSNAQLRAFGSLDTAANRLLLWVDNSEDTWAAALAPTPASGTISVALPTDDYTVEWWNTRTGVLTGTTQITSDGTLLLALTDIISDVALKVYPA